MPSIYKRVMDKKKSQSVYFYDIESSQLNRGRLASERFVTELSVVDIDGKCVFRYHQSQTSMHVHQIIARMYSQLSKPCVLVGYNSIRFDEHVLTGLCRRTDAKLPQEWSFADIGGSIKRLTKLLCNKSELVRVHEVFTKRRMNVPKCDLSTMSKWLDSVLGKSENTRKRSACTAKPHASLTDARMTRDVALVYLRWCQVASMCDDDLVRWFPAFLRAYREREDESFKKLPVSSGKLFDFSIPSMATLSNSVCSREGDTQALCRILTPRPAKEVVDRVMLKYTHRYGACTEKRSGVLEKRLKAMAEKIDQLHEQMYELIAFVNGNKDLL